MSPTPPVIAEETGIAVSSDKTRLFYRAWAPEGASATAPIALVLHGIGLHSRPYRVVADALVPHGIRVVAMDLRGHGRSGGTRGRGPSPAAVVADLDAITAKLRSAYGVDVVHLVGESMGTLVALHYAVARPEVVASLVLIGSAIRIARAQVLRAENLKLLPALVFSRDRPVVNLIGTRLDEACSDEAFKRERREDPLALRKASVNYLLGLRRLRAGWRRKARAVHTPTLLIHGQRDAVVDWRGADALRRVLASEAKQLIYFESARHTLFWDPATPRVFQMIQTWFDARSGHG